MKQILKMYFVACVLCSVTAIAADQNWPSFRGDRASGVREGFAVASKWDVPKGENILWKTPVKGLGYSCPVIWGDRVFITTAVSKKSKPRVKVGLYGNVESVNESFKHTWKVLCFDRKSGKEIWAQDATTGVPKIKRHAKSSHANSTAATDGKHVVAFFGAEGLYCYDMDGKLLWKKDLGQLDAGWYVSPDAQWGFGSSPIIHAGMVIVQCDVQKKSFIAAFNVKTGKEVWRTPRDEVPTWSTPTVYEADGKLRLALNGYKRMGGYDLLTGKPVWRLDGSGGDIPVPTPVVSKNLIYFTNAHGAMAPMIAISKEANGDVVLPSEASANKSVAWWHARRGNYMQTPIAYDGLLYGCMDSGVMTCFDPESGEIVYRERLGKGTTGFTASPVAADGKLFFTSEEGDVYVIKAGRKFEVLSTNPLGEVCMATPAISQGVLFFRTNGHLIAVAPPKQ
jgi:outer membrane protein assembly factor BamB